MLPADQGLDRDDLAGRELDLRLVVQLELAPLDRVAQLLDEAQPVADAVEVLLVDREALAGELRAVHGEVGAAQKVAHAGGVVGHEGDADAGADLRAHGVEHERLLEPRGQARRDRRCVVGVRVEQGDGELVSTEADEQIRGSQRSLEPCGEQPEQLVAGRVPEGVVDLLEAVQVDEQERERPCRRIGVGLLLEEVLEQLQHRAAIGETGQLVGDRLHPPVLGERAQSHERHRAAQSGGDDRGGRESERDVTEVAQRAHRQDRHGAGGREAGEDEARLGVATEPLGAGGAHPHRGGDEQDRGRPCDRVEQAADLRGADRVLEQVEGVADDVQRQARREHQPRRLATAREHRRPADHERQQQGVPDRVGEVRGGSERAQPGVLHHVVERERRADRGGADAGDGTVEPGVEREPAHLASHQHHQRDVGERVEAEVERVGQGWVGHRPGLRLRRQRQVADRPRHQGGAEHERHGPRALGDQSVQQAKCARHELEHGDAPAVDRVALRPARTEGPPQHVAEQRDGEQGVCPRGSPRGPIHVLCTHWPLVSGARVPN